jgi:hypothetical protein
MAGLVMPGLDPAIQELAKNLDARIKSGHDKGGEIRKGIPGAGHWQAA